MSLPNLSALSDSGLLDLYGRVATVAMMSRLFNLPGPVQEVLEAKRELSCEISERGLDRGPDHADS